MQTALLQQGELILDAAGFVSLGAVVNACQLPFVRGFSFYTPDPSWPNRYGVGRDQVQAAVDHGRLVGPNWERRGNEAMFNSPGGAAAVDSACRGCEIWGLDPSSVPTILSGVDFSTNTADWPQLDYWHEMACDRADATNVWIGYYGETKYGNHLIQQPFWTRVERPTWTWGGAGVMNNTNLKQEYGYPSGNDYSSIGVTVDESRGVAGLIMVSSFDSPIPPVTQGDSSMGQHLGWLQLTDDAGNPLAGVYGELMMNFDTSLARTSTVGDGIGVFGFTLGRASQGAYNALPNYNPDADWAWALSHAPQPDLSAITAQLNTIQGAVVSSIPGQLNSIASSIAAIQSQLSNGFAAVNNNITLVGASVAACRTQLDTVKATVDLIKTTTDSTLAAVNALTPGSGGDCDLTPVLTAIAALEDELHHLEVKVTLATTGTTT